MYYPTPLGLKLIYLSVVFLFFRMKNQYYVIQTLVNTITYNDYYCDFSLLNFGYILDVNTHNWIPIQRIPKADVNPMSFRSVSVFMCLPTKYVQN